MTTASDFSAPAPGDATDALLYGSDPLPGLVAVDLAGPDRVRLYRRADDHLTASDDDLAPWLLAERAEPWQALRSRPTIDRLDGDHPLRFLVTFRSWPDMLDAARAARDANERIFRLRSPVEGYLMRRGRTLFKGMTFGDVRRLQLDIETAGLDPHRSDAAVLMVALTTSWGVEDVLALEDDEADLIDRLTERIVALDPDVIEGHNIFNFDLPYLAARAERNGVALRWGRDGSAVRIDERGGRFKAGPLTVPYSPAWIHGRHVIDTYQQIQRYDTGGKLTSYGLKNAIRELGLTRSDRTFVPGTDVLDAWRTDRDRLIRYAVDDVRDVDTLSRLATQTEFYQTQILPRSFQAVATGGPGEKINDLMLRAYLAAGHSIPNPEPSRDYPGGHAELLETGVFAPVVKCDVESLYPSIMLAEQITSKADTLGAYLPMLADLTRRRLAAKAASRDMARAGNHDERAMWDGLQGSFKVLINSFYGYLGYRGALFNDYDAATRVTLSGQRIVVDVVERLRRAGAIPIEVDTDGVYFVPPPGIEDEAAETAFIDAISHQLPNGIRLAHDGRFAAMLSLRLKTYALLDEHGALTLKGSALRSRRVEPCFREFIGDAARSFLEGRGDDARAAYFALAERIRRRDVSARDVVQWGMLSDDAQPTPRLKRLIDRGRRTGEARAGDRIEYYERQDGELAFLSEFDNDVNQDYLLRRLRDVAMRFRELFPSDAAFDAAFPPLSVRTDLVLAKQQEAATQLGLFG
jgi:DNA polymerase elongation subunit (family B)